MNRSKFVRPCEHMQEIDRLEKGHMFYAVNDKHIEKGQHSEKRTE